MLNLKRRKSKNEKIHFGNEPPARRHPDIENVLYNTLMENATEILWILRLCFSFLFGIMMKKEAVL